VNRPSGATIAWCALIGAVAPGALACSREAPRHRELAVASTATAPAPAVAVGAAAETDAPGCGEPLGAPDRRLTRFELAYAVSDVFGVDASSLHELPRAAAGIGEVPDILVGRLLDTSDRFLGPYRAKVATLAQAIARRLAPSCARNRGAALAPCVAARLREPAARLGRGTLDGALADIVRAGAGSRDDARTMFAAAVTHLLVSPRFYMLDNEQSPRLLAGLSSASPSPRPDPEVGRRRRLASRLALALWSSVPDQELLSRAESGALDDPAAFDTEVARMMADRRFRRFGRELARQWLRLDRPPLFRASLDMRALVEDRARLGAIEDEAARLLQRHIDEDLAIEELVTGHERSGLLTSGAVLAAISSEIRGGGNESWLGRGLIVQSALLCRTFPLAAVYPEHLWHGHPLLDPHASAATRRPSEERLLAIRTRDRPCRECHRQLETIGAALAMFDGLGLPAAPPSSAGGAAAAAQVAGQSITGPAELGAWIADSGRFQPCVAQKLLGYLLGRAVLPAKRAADRCLVRSLAGAGVNDARVRRPTMRGWLLAILRSPAFARQGAVVVHDTPNVSPSAELYSEPLPAATVGAVECRGFDPGAFLVGSCGSSACHGPGAAASIFAVPDGARAAELLLEGSPAGDGYCGEHAGFVDRRRPGDSLVVRKLTAGGKVCGAPMPLTGGPRSLDPRQHACFVRWVEETARSAP
jgi:hypothetical protein